MADEMVERSWRCLWPLARSQQQTMTARLMIATTKIAEAPAPPAFCQMVFESDSICICSAICLRWRRWRRQYSRSLAASSFGGHILKKWKLSDSSPLNILIFGVELPLLRQLEPHLNLIFRNSPSFSRP